MKYRKNRCKMPLFYILIALGLIYCIGYGRCSMGISASTITVDGADGLISEIVNANEGDIIEITGDVHLPSTIDVTKDITIQSNDGNNFTIFKNAGGRHFNVSANLTLKNITLDGEDTSGGVTLNRNGHLIMDAGSIIQNCLAHNTSGGGIYAYAFGSGAVTSLTMKSGSIIRSCTTRYYGGGIYAGSNSVITMEAGSAIQDCTSIDYGGGIYINDGKFFMEGGKITGCRATGGGGIFLYYSDSKPSIANVTINGGEIKGCEAQFGGGALFQNTERVMIMDAVVTDNYSATYGGGIAILVGGILNINDGLVKGNSALLADGREEQIYILADHYPQDGKVYTVMDTKSSGTSSTLLNGEINGLVFFKVYDNKTGENLVAFCSELGQSVSTSNYYVNYFLPNVRLTKEQMDKIAITVRVALNGNLSYDNVVNNIELSNRAYVAQYIIWNIEAGYHNSEMLITTKERIQTALGSDAAECVEEIVNEIKRYEDHITPSFAGNTRENASSYFLEYDEEEEGYKVILTDINGVLSYFSINQSALPQGLEATINDSNNTLTITCVDRAILQDGGVIELSYVFGEENATVYFHPLYQDLAVPDGTYEIKRSAYINLLISSSTTTPEPSGMPEPSDTPEPSGTPKPSDTPEPSGAPEPSDTPKPSGTSKPSDTPEPSGTPEPSDMPEFSDTPKPSGTPKLSAASQASDITKSNPKTGDNQTLLYALIFISILGIVIISGLYIWWKKEK